MVNKTAITRNLSDLHSRYDRRPRNSRDPLYYSKLYLIELCGWIEETMDSIVRDCSLSRLAVAKNRKQVESDIVGRTYGFDYGAHFRNMLIRVLGLIKVEELESMLDQIKFDKMRSSLTTLLTQRNRAAHTYTEGTTQTVDAPSVIVSHFQNVYEGLKDMEQCIRRLRI